MVKDVILSTLLRGMGAFKEIFLFVGCSLLRLCSLLFQSKLTIGTLNEGVLHSAEVASSTFHPADPGLNLNYFNICQISSTVL